MQEFITTRQGMADLACHHLNFAGIELPRGNDRLATGFISRYSGPHLMALALGNELPTREGVVEYASALDSFG